MVLHWSNFCTSLCAVLLLFLIAIPSGQGQGQLQFLGEPPFRAYASRSTLVGQVLYRLFTVDDNSDVISNGLTYSIEQSSSEHFNLHPDTGELVLGTPFSFLMDHTLVLQASSVSHSTVQAMLVVTVVPESDMTPRYEREAYNLSVSEGHPVGRPFSIVRVFPLSSISSPTYSIVSETGGGIFSVDPNNGLLTITQSLDREQIDRYALTVRYSYDRDKFVDTEVLISVTDVNDNPPLFTRSLYNVTVPENVAVPISILTLSAMDLDIGINSRVRYSFDDPPSEFSLDSETGIVSVLSALDHERASSYQLSVTASDTGEPPASSTAVLVISVRNIDNECPIFENQLYIADIAGSKVQAGQEILTVVARDPDNLSGVSYSVVSSNADGILSLDPNTGVLSVASAASLSGQYSLNISTSDGSCLAGSYASVMVRIMDDNAHRPEIVTQCNAMLPENSPTGTEVITLQANDPDTGLNGQVTFSLLNTSYFSISPTTGVVVTNQIPERYNRETQEVFEVGVIAVDGGLRQDYCLLTITLSDKNDNRPNFLLQEYNISLAPNTAPMTVVGMVTAFDADVGSNGNISYTLSNPTPAPFAIDPCTGEIRTTAPVNDISVDISLSVTARDMGNPVSLSSTALVHLSLLPGAPVFSQTYYNVTICENTPANKPILTLEASFTPTFQLLSGSEYSSNSEGTFTLTGNIIRVSSEDIPNYESLSSSRRSFLFPVLATNSLGRSTAIVEIFLADLDDNSPEVDSGFSFTLAENQPAGVVVTQILAHDPDSGTNGEIAYRLEAPSTLFNVSSTGVVRSLRMFDFEGANEVLSGTLRVQLFNPNPPQSAEALREFCGNDVFLLPQNTVVNVMWSITDQNDNPPSFERTVYSVQLPEDQPTLTSVFTFNATDLDASDRQSGLNFLITSGNEEGTFAIDGNSLVLIGRLDFERTTSYDLLVLVTDGIHSRGNACPRCMASLVITVSDIDDESPVFASPTHQLDVVEQLPVGTTILTLSAQDVDTPTIRYQLSGQAQGRLNISNSGEIIVSGDLDREELENGTLPFLVFAEGGGIGVTEVFINLLDINDHAPRFLEVFGGRVQENTPPGDEGIFVTNVQAQDSDAGQNGTVTYSLVDGMESGFEIDSDTGVITANMEFDREAQSVYYLTVQASDNGVPSQLTSVTIVTVSIDDVNDNAPFFPFPYMFARVFEDATIGSHVLNIPVVDPDASSNLNFTLLSASPLGLYALDPDTGEVMVAGSLDYELPLHRNTTLRIALQDDVFTAEMIGVLTILLLDRNDNAPIVDPPVYSSVVGSTRMVAETLPPGQLLASLSADDVDEGSNGELVYSIVSGDERGDFNVSSRGRVSNTRQLDYETTNQYTLTVAVSDKGDPPLSSLVTLEFNIQDINDNTPSFSQNVYLVDIQENAEPTGSVFRISATDPDTNQGGQIGAYAIVSGNEGSEFILNATSGVLGTSVSFDREMTDSYMLVVTATDRGADPQTGTGTIVVTITDQNDNPSLSGGVQYVYINATNGQIQPGPIGQVYFRDPDISNTFTACMLQDFSFTSLFAVSSSDCSLSLLQSEIEEGTYPLPIIGRDGVHTSVTTSVIVIVEHISNETYPEGGVVTLTLNASAREYYELRLNVTIPNLLAQQLGVELRDVHVISLQPGYHNPIRTIDMTISAMGAEGVLISPIEVLNRLFQNREQLFLAGRGVLSLPTDPCVAEPCSNQARCVARRAIDIARPALVTEQYILVAPRVTLDFECECVPGTSGESCEINFDDCYSAPCLHAAVCTDLVQGFVCDCPDGTSGSDCSFNPDECASNPCLNNAECVNGLGTYICSCLPGFYGRECQYARFQISPTCDSSLCLNGAACSPGRHSFTCLCAEGFNGTLCETPVQLQGGCVGNPCHNGSRCVDTAEGARCLCSPGFTGPFCRWPLDNCELEPCRNGATCEMGHYGSFLCTCAEGYTGENCTERVPACESTPCLNGGRCNDLQDSGFICQCTRNFTGEHCETPLLPPDLCEVDPAPCPLDANCTAGISATTCTCPPDLYGPDCSIVTMNDACSSNPCLHGSQCELAPPPLNYSCSCSVGYTGVNCEVNIDDCVSEPCLNGGRCEDGVGGYVCECGEGMTGDVCQIFCPDGQQGEFCEVGMSQCILASCSNGGTCMETLREGGAGGMVQCQCPDTHTGPTCDVPNDCSTTRCLNGGTCSSLPSGGVECQCPGGFDGPNCELVAVTFTGGSTRSSYRAYQPLELQGRGRVRLEFVTRSSRGLLLFSTQYQAGVSRDWLAVEVVEERVRVSVALGSGGGEVVVMGSSVRVSDGLWHQVSVETSGKSYQVLLDQCQMLEEGLLALSQCTAAAVTPGNSSFLDLGLPLWIGGVPFSTPPHPFQLSSVGFSGCVRNVLVDGELLDLEGHIEQRSSERGCGQVDGSCAGGRCGEGECVPSLGEFSCVCPALRAGDSCQNAATSLQFSNGNYAQYSLTIPEVTANLQIKRQATHPTRSTLSDSLSLRFRTETSTGILFHVGGLEPGEDYVYVAFQDDGRLSYHINLGSGEERVEFPAYLPALDDALWHFLELERTALDLTVTLDNFTFSHTLGGNQLYLDVAYEDFYAAGPPRMGAGQYSGCLRDVRVDDSVLPTSGSNRFASVTYRGDGGEGSEVKTGCGLRGCFPDPCAGGRCVESGETGFVCECEDGSRLISRPCSEPEQETPYLLIIIIVVALVVLMLLLALAILVMICWRRHTNRKLAMLNLDGRRSPISDVLLATRDCVIISNDAGGGEQDTTMTDEKWQQNMPLPRKEGHEDKDTPTSSSSPTSSGSSIDKPLRSETTTQQQQYLEATMTSQQPTQTRAKSPVISAFIDQRLEALRKEYPDHDSIQVFSDEGEGTSKVSLDSFCSYQSKEEPYTTERLRQAGPAFQRFAGLLEVLGADEEETVDLESELVHTGLTQTQTQSQGGAGSQGNGVFFF